MIADPLSLVPYDPAWPARFAAYRVQLAAALGPAALRIDHIGSTAVPGLVAKNVIDSQVIVADQSDVDSYVPALASIGIELRHREPEWSMLRPPAPPRTRWVAATGWHPPRA